jgi:hypothetical protein
MLEAFVTNLGRYNEGYLDGEPLKLPATTEEVQALLKRIHVDGVDTRKFLLPIMKPTFPACVTAWANMKALTS